MSAWETECHVRLWRECEREPGPTLEVLASNQLGVGRIAVSDGEPYWSRRAPAPAEGTEVVNLVDGAIRVLAVEPEREVREIAVGGGFLYYTAALPGMGTRDRGMVKRLSVWGGSPESVADDAGDPYDIVLDDRAAYWVDLSFGRVMTAPLVGGAAAPLADAMAPRHIAVDRERVYFSAVGDLGDVPKRGGTRRLLSHVAGGPVAVDDDALYFVGKDGRLHILPRRGGAPREIAVEGSAVDLTVRGPFLYYLTEPSLAPGAGCQCAAFGRVQKQGGAPVTLLRRRHVGTRLTMDGEAVYVSSARAWTVARLLLPADADVPAPAAERVTF